MADAPQLRWVKYGEVSYPALLWTDGQPPVEVPQDHVFVIFLGDNSGAAVPLADVSPYDANDVAKTSHPDVAAGVAEAAAIIRGSAVGGADDDGGDVPSSKKTKKVKKERRDEDEEISTSRRHKRNHEDDEEDALLGVGTLSKPKPAAISDSDVDSDDDDDDSEEDWGGDVERLYRQSHNNNNNSNGLRTGDGPIARRGARGATFGGATAHMMMMKSSPVAPYLHELRFCYARRREEANVGKKAISCQELDVIRAAEQHLYGQQCGAHLLRRQSELSSTSEAREMLRDMADQLQRAPLQVDLLVASTAQLRVAPTDAPRGRHRHLRPAGEGGDDDQDEISTLHSFVDPIVHNTIRTITSNLAPPRELTHDLANRLREQRLHRERVLNAHRGLLNKTGLVAAPRTLEKWRQARELMMVAPVVETQDVLPTGFISRRHAEVAARVEAHAMRRLQKGIRGGAPPTSNNNTNNNVSSASGVGVSGFTPGSIAEMVATYQSTGGISARRAKPSTPAYYNFHELSIDQQHRNTATRNGGVAGGASLAAGFLDDLHEGPASAAMLDGPSDTFLANNNNNNINALVPPLTLGFDARAVFHADGGREDPHLVGKSLLYSTSIGLPSQESVWCSVMDGTGDDGQAASNNNNNNNNTTKRAAPSRRSGRHLSTSRASSLASSIAYSDGGSRAGGDDDAHARGGWREAAKKAIIRQLSHYTRPREDGKPPVLDAADFKHIAKSLLERAVRTEAERSGLSMALRINNEHATFTKEVEWALRKSVDGYVRRHYLRPEGDADGSEDEEGSLMRRHHHQQQQRTHASSKVAAEGLSSVAPASAIPSVLPHGAEDSPLYE